MKAALVVVLIAFGVFVWIDRDTMNTCQLSRTFDTCYAAINP